MKQKVFLLNFDKNVMIPIRSLVPSVGFEDVKRDGSTAYDISSSLINEEGNNYEITIVTYKDVMSLMHVPENIARLVLEKYFLKWLAVFINHDEEKSSSDVRVILARIIVEYATEDCVRHLDSIPREVKKNG